MKTFQTLVILLSLATYSQVASADPTAEEIQEWITYTHEPFDRAGDKFYLRKGEDECSIEAVWSFKDTYDEKVIMDFSRNLDVSGGSMLFVKDPTEQMVKQSFNFNLQKYNSGEPEIYGRPRTTGIVIIEINQDEDGKFFELIERFKNAFGAYLDVCRPVKKDLF